MTEEERLSDESPLKRDIGGWGSFSMGYADVGADIYIVLGVIALFAGVASPLAFLMAAITYVCTGLCYAELATAYPVAGGGQFYSMKAFGRIHGFVAGWGLMLDYTIDIALFALATVGYLGMLTVMAFHSGIFLLSPFYGLTAIALILALLALNVLGIKYSSRFNEVVVAANIVTIAVFLAIGLPYVIGSGALAAWASSVFLAFKTGSFGLGNFSSFAYAISLATASYIGIESIAQAAEETKNPSRVIPRSAKAAIVSVIAIAVSLSLLSVTLSSWQSVSSNSQAPAVQVALQLPLIGASFAVLVAFMGTMSCYVSTNTGVVGVSRVMFSMGRLGLMPKALSRVNRKFRTPWVTILLFGAISCLLLLVNIALPGTDLLSLVASIYNFGALVAYMYVNAAALMLRVKEPERAGWKMPLNLRVKNRQVSIVPVMGFASSALFWFLIVGLHPIGRVVGAAWFIVGIALYLFYQKKVKSNGKP